MANKRKDERIVITSTATITVLTDDSVMAPFDGTVISISPGGVGLCAQTPVKRDSKMEVVLKFIDIEGKQRKETAQGRVVWQNEIPPYCVFGVEFTGLNGQDHPGLLGYLQSKTEQLNLKE